jgi:hypothetical protein
VRQKASPTTIWSLSADAGFSIRAAADCCFVVAGLSRDSHGGFNCVSPRSQGNSFPAHKFAVRGEFVASLVKYAKAALAKAFKHLQIF